MLTHWTRADNYVGKDFSRYLEVMGQHRESDALQRSNFRAALKRLGGESETVLVVRFGHWAVGWTESLLVDPDNAEAVAEAVKIAEELESYPVLDEDDWSELETEEIEAYWARMSVDERQGWCRDAGLPLDAGLGDGFPYTEDGYTGGVLWDMMRA